MPNEALPDPEALLHDRGWLLRLARGLVADEGEAEELAQEAWAAGQDPGAPARPHRGWYRSVLDLYILVGRRAARSAHRDRFPLDW